MQRPSLMATFSVLALLTLSGCGGFGSKPSTLAPLPADLATCFQTQVDPPQGTLSKAEVMTLIADLKRSDEGKTLCGQRLIRLYESQT